MADGGVTLWCAIWGARPLFERGERVGTHFCKCAYGGRLVRVNEGECEWGSGDALLQVRLRGAARSCERGGRCVGQWGRTFVSAPTWGGSFV